MRKEKLNGHEFEFYDEIGEMSIARFHSYSRYMLVACGVGDSLSDIDEHITKILQFISIDLKKAQRELLNLRQNLFMVASERDLRYKAFLYFTYKVDGKEWEDFSDSGIDELYQLVNGAKIKELNKVTNEVVGKIDDALRQYFPNFFDSSVEKNQIDLLRKRALLQVDEVLNGSDKGEEIGEITKKIFSVIVPKDFDNDKAVVEFDRQFENMCLVLSKEFGSKVKDYSIMEFYSAYNLMNEQQKEINKIRNKRR